MKLKEMKNNEHNLLDAITFFDSIPDTTPYFTELIYLYGNRNVLPAIEELFSVDSIHGVGMIFDLKSREWEDLEDIRTIIKETVTTGTKITTNKTNVGNVKKTGNTTQNNVNDDYIIPYDVSEETKQSKTDKTDMYNNSEDIETDDTGTTETVYTGFDKDRFENLTMIFKNYPEIRYKIYADIVNMLCLQTYDYIV